MKYVLLPLSLFIMLLGSCAKSDDAVHNYVVSGPYSNMDDVYSGAAQRPTTASMSVSGGGSVRSLGGTRFIIPANAFVDASGKTITGSVDVSVNDWVKRGDMVYGKVLPVGIADPLECGGQALINVTQNGKSVFVKPGMQMQINLPQFGRSTPGLQVFTGTTLVEGANTVQWVAADSGGRKILRYVTDTIALFTDSVGYYNADRFLTSPNYQDYDVKAVADSGSLIAVRAFTFFDQHNAVWPMRAPGTDGIMHEGHVPNIPVHIVVMGLSNGYFYGGTLAVTPQTGQTYIVTLHKTDAAAFKQSLNGL